MITSEEEFDQLNIQGYYYRPEQYLSKYLFTQEILLDVFCSESLVCTFEDDYYNDINIDMIIEYQPHINSEEFLMLWKDLDEILVVEQFCRYILNHPNYVVNHLYNSISEMIKIKDINQFIKKMLIILETNKFIIKYNLNDKLQNITGISEMKIVVNEILAFFPKKYSSILPL